MSDVKIWNKKNLKSKIKFTHHPYDYVLRSILSNSYFDIKNVKEKGSILDIGTLFLNNLIPFNDRKFHCYGTEVTPQSVLIAKQLAKKMKIKCNIKLGFNKDIPFKKNKFDIVLSINTIHYEENVSDVKKSFQEFKRVCKPNGVVLIVTDAPNHHFFKKSKKINTFKYKLNIPRDPRNGQIFTFFKYKKDLLKIALNYFNKVEIGRFTEKYPKSTLDFWILKCRC